MSVKVCFLALLSMVTVSTSFGQTNEPTLQSTYQSPIKPSIRTVAYQQPNQVADIQATPQSILWLGDLEHATELSLKTGRPILLHFEQPNCRGSQQATQITFKNPEFIQTVYDQFIPVRINVLAKPELGQRFEITQTPTDIVLDAEGELIYRGVTETNAASYSTKLATYTYASSDQESALAIDVGFEVDNVDFSQPQATPALASQVSPANYPQQVPINTQTTAPGTQYPAYNPVPQANRTYQNSQPQQNIAPRQTQQIGLPQQNLPPAYPQVAAAPQQPLQTQPPRPIHQPPLENQLQPPNVQIPTARADQTKIGLDGYCPVSLSDLNADGAKWVKGDPKHGIIHRGRLYFFAGSHELEVFRKFPERLAPVISGYDPVMFTDQQQLVDGIRELGVSYKGQVFLFHNKRSLQQFWTAPDHYAATANAAMQRTR